MSVSAIVNLLKIRTDYLTNAVLIGLNYNYLSKGIHSNVCKQSKVVHSNTTICLLIIQFITTIPGEGLTVRFIFLDGHNYIIYILMSKCVHTEKILFINKLTVGEQGIYL